MLFLKAEKGSDLKLIIRALWPTEKDPKPKLIMFCFLSQNYQHLGFGIGK